MMTTLKNEVSEDEKRPKKTFAPPGKKASTIIPCSPDIPNNEETQEIRLPEMNARQSPPKDKTQKKKKEKIKRKSSESDKEGKGLLATKTSKEQGTKGNERKIEKDTPHLTNEQFEEIVQCVLKKSLQECLDMTCETSCAQCSECSPRAKETSITTATTDVDRKLLGIPHPPRIPVTKEDIIVPGSQSPKSELLPSEKKQNMLSLSKKGDEAKDEKTELTKRSYYHRRKGQPRKIVQGYTQISDQETGEEWTSNFNKNVAWVQCSFRNCKKWRQLHGDIDPSALPEDWSCSQNTDLQYNHCDIPEETWSGCDSEVVYASYIPGSIIWAKQYGYPWWPGMVESDPDLGEYFLFASEQDVLPSKYHVTFFGDTATRAWIPSNMLKNFQELSLTQVEPVRSSQESKKRVRHKDYSQKLMAALVMAREAQRISIQDRVSLFGFHTRYNENAAGSDSSEEGEEDLFFQETRKLQRAGSSNSCISKEENKEPSSSKGKPAYTSRKKLKLKGLKKKFTTPQRKTTVTRSADDRAPQNQSPPTQSPAGTLMEAGKKSDPQWSLVLMSRKPSSENKASSDLNVEQLMEEVREGINQKGEQQAPIDKEDEISLVLSEE